MEIVLQPCGSSGSERHFADTILKPVILGSIKKYLNENDYINLKKLYPDNKLYIWGIAPTTKFNEDTNEFEITSNNKTKWTRIKENETFVLFYANKNFFAKGLVVKTLNNKKLAKYLWGINDKNVTWEYIYFIQNIEELHLPLEDFKSITGYGAPVIQGFSVMANKEQKDALISKLDNFDIPNYNEIEETMTDDIEDIDEHQEYTEGEKKVRRHIARERNSKVINDAKKAFKNKHGKLYCEACEFDFNSVYGDRGEDYIEGHHTNFVSDSNGKMKTKIKDIAMLCSNCHRMIHTKRPWLTIEELKDIINRV